MPGSLEGIRVIDLTTIYSGPICTSILGDQGADIIKVESPDGDWMRVPIAQQRNGVSGAFAMMNRNKRSIVINLRTNEGQQILKKLVEQSDVLVENFRPGVMKRLGLGYESLKSINKKLIYASINGFGEEGPYVERRVYDAVIQAVSGMGALQADPSVDQPIFINQLICDKLTSVTAAQVISSALVARERSGIGQQVQISMLDASLFFLWPDAMLNFTFVGDDVAKSPYGSHAIFVRKTKDGYVCTMPVKEPDWLGLFRALDLPNLLDDDRFGDQHPVGGDLWQKTINEAYLKFTTNELMPRLEKNEVPCAKINARPDVINDPQVKAMGSLIEFEHPIGGPMRQPRPPGRFSETPANISRTSPELGQQTREILQEFGYDDGTITELRSKKVVR